MDRKVRRLLTEQNRYSRRYCLEAGQFNRCLPAMLTWIKAGHARQPRQRPIGAPGFLVKGSAQGYCALALAAVPEP